MTFFVLTGLKLEREIRAFVRCLHLVSLKRTIQKQLGQQKLYQTKSTVKSYYINKYTTLHSTSFSPLPTQTHIHMHARAHTHMYILQPQYAYLHQKLHLHTQHTSPWLQYYLCNNAYMNTHNGIFHSCISSTLQE